EDEHRPPENAAEQAVERAGIIGFGVERTLRERPTAPGQDQRQEHQPAAASGWRHGVGRPQWEQAHRKVDRSRCSVNEPSAVSSDPMMNILPDLAAALGGAYRFERELGGGGMSRAGAVGHLPPNVPPIVKDAIGYLMLASRAYLTLARADSAAALREFPAPPGTAGF